MDSVLCHIHSAIDSIQQVFHLSYCIFEFIFVWFFFITSISLLRFPIFFFVSREFIIDYGGIFVRVALKFLSNNSTSQD